jgi:hypothetical protein
MFKKLFGGILGGGSESQSVRSFEQRRKLARRPCEIEVEVTVGRKGHMATVVDLGPGGMRLCCELPLKAKPKTLVRVTYPGSIPKHDVLTVECVVRWSKLRQADGAEFVGLEYKDQKALARSWVKAKMLDLGFSSYNLKEQRAHHRVVAQLLGTLEIGGVTRNCVVGDLGLGGLYIQLHQPIRAGAVIDVKVKDSPRLPGTTYVATVRHQQQADPGDPFGYGCSFTRLSEEQAEAIKEFLVEQHEQNWERTEPWPDLLYIASAEAAGQSEQVEIPDLASILAEDDEEQHTS